MVQGYKGDVVLDGINTALVPLDVLRLVFLYICLAHVSPVAINFKTK